jgi:hypothetical protein
MIVKGQLDGYLLGSDMLTGVKDGCSQRIYLYGLSFLKISLIWAWWWYSNNIKHLKELLKVITCV